MHVVRIFVQCTDSCQRAFIPPPTRKAWRGGWREAPGGVAPRARSLWDSWGQPPPDRPAAGHPPRASLRSRGRDKRARGSNSCPVSTCRNILAASVLAELREVSRHQSATLHGVVFDILGGARGRAVVGHSRGSNPIDACAHARQASRGREAAYATLSRIASSAACTASGVPTCIQTPSSLSPNSRSCSLARSNILVSENSPAGASAKIAGEMIAAPA